MDAGYDYLLLRSRLRHKVISASAIFFIVTGVVLLGAGAAYFVYVYKARADLDQLNFALPSAGTSQAATAAASPPLDLSPLPSSDPSPPQPAESFRVDGSNHGSGEFLAADLGVDGSGTTLAPPSETARVSGGEETPLSMPLAAIAGQKLYPGDSIQASSWGSPLEYEPRSYVEASLVQGFRPVDPVEAAAMEGTLPSPDRVIIPAIGVDSEVQGLRIQNLGDNRAYETPKHVVGHIPESSNPGEAGSSWLFGHLESPIAREGSVFYNLPKIPNLLRQGEDVYVIVESGARAYLYKITEAFVVHRDQLSLNYERLRSVRPQYAQLDPDGANLHLVTCVPRLVYDSRLVVSGSLVGIRG